MKKIYNYKNLLLVFGDYNVITREMNTIFLPKELEMSFLKNKRIYLHNFTKIIAIKEL